MEIPYGYEWIYGIWIAVVGIGALAAIANLIITVVRW